MGIVAAKWFDISMPVAGGMPHWPGDPDVRIERIASLDRGDNSNVTALSMCAHTGTHVDAPRHYFAHGAAIDQMPPEAGVGTARVMEIAECAATIFQPGGRVLLRTGGSATLTLAAARALAASGLLLVGVDALSIGPDNKEGDEIHRALLGAGVWILEGLDLSAVEPGDYDLFCLPLRIEGADGAPARAFLRLLA